ncbi:nucleotidyltransferase domain-containing protein [Desulfobacter sp.]|uniref:nucleotidyltransferase domain-containing protein n=1 Tax=Desulfobacter sp. TaxID=2294 RepID=UPI003D138331
MAEVPHYIVKYVKDYIKILDKNGFTIQQAILFGSFVRGNFNEFSDIDIALVSDKFEGIRFNDRNRIRKYKFDVSADIEPIPFTLADFTESDPLVKEILETGIRIV